MKAKSPSNTRLEPPMESRAGQTVYAHLLRELVSGQLPPGGRLPTRRALIQRLETTPVTVQRAFDRLTEAGFIESRGKLGTFVVRHPPHRHHVAMIFKATPAESEWRHFWTVLSQAADGIAKEGEWVFKRYYGIRADSPDADLSRLCHDAAEHRLAGVFYASTPPPLPALRRIRLPGAAVTPSEIKGLTSICVDQEDFLRKSVDWLVGRGCRRIGLIAIPGYDAELLPAFQAMLSDAGLVSDDRWFQFCHQNHPHWAANLIALMFSLAHRNRPDGLIVADDNLTTDVRRGFDAIGITPGRDVHMVSHANFPASDRSIPADIQRIGYDNTAILRYFLDIVLARRQHFNLSPRVVIPACLEAESVSTRTAKHIQAWSRASNTKKTNV